MVSINNGNTNISRTVQQTIINLNLADLEKPYVLSVKTDSPEAQLIGKIKIDRDGIPLQSTIPLLGTETILDLSIHLSKGRNIIKISGNYIPKNASVTTKLLGASTQVSQTIGGNGKLMHIMIIDVR